MQDKGNISPLRKELRSKGIMDEDMLFDDALDGKGIIPRVVFRKNEVTVVGHDKVSIPQAERCDPSGNQDSPEQLSDL